MNRAACDTCQLAGFDSNERGFSRPVVLEPAGEGYRAVLRYEALQYATDSRSGRDEALALLVARLQAEGYRQLRTQMSFRSGQYLGSQEPWIEYPDPPPQQERGGWLARLSGWFRPRAVNE